MSSAMKPEKRAETASPKVRMSGISVTLTHKQIEFLSQKPNVSKYVRELVDSAISLEKKERWTDKLISEIRDLDGRLRSLRDQRTMLYRKGINESEEQRRRTSAAIEATEAGIEAVRRRAREAAKVLGVDIGGEVG